MQDTCTDSYRRERKREHQPGIKRESLKGSTIGSPEPEELVCGRRSSLPESPQSSHGGDVGSPTSRHPECAQKPYSCPNTAQSTRSSDQPISEPIHIPLDGTYPAWNKLQILAKLCSVVLDHEITAGDLKTSSTSSESSTLHPTPGYGLRRINGSVYVVPNSTESLPQPDLHPAETDSDDGDSLPSSAPQPGRDSEAPPSPERQETKWMSNPDISAPYDYMNLAHLMASHGIPVSAYPGYGAYYATIPAAIGGGAWAIDWQAAGKGYSMDGVNPMTTYPPVSYASSLKRGREEEEGNTRNPMEHPPEMLASSALAAETYSRMVGSDTRASGAQVTEQTTSNGETKRPKKRQRVSKKKSTEPKQVKLEIAAHLDAMKA
ncbi:hypothetical protein HK104_005474 [Borealophlyctis nickersoniae]|nr:hypothetical protein HK104_005474 [Borealophlyctis nickersoniae]